MPSPENSPRPEQEAQPKLLSEQTVGLTTRLMLGAENLNPEHKVSNLTPDSFENGRTEDTLAKVGKLSHKERQAFWQGKHDNNPKSQKEAWSKQVASSLEQKLATLPEDEKQKWQQSLSKLGLTQTPTQDTVMAFYQTYLTKPQEGLEKFVADIIEKHIDQAGNIEQKVLRDSLPAVKWMANVFGADSSKLIDCLIEGTASSNEELVTQANKTSTKEAVIRINNLNPEEQRLLKLLTNTTKPEEVEKPEAARNGAVRLKKEDVEKITSKQAELIKLPSGENVAYKELVDRLMHPETGKAGTEQIALDKEYQKLLEKAKTESVANKAGPGTLLLTPTLLAQIEAIANQANLVKKELSFMLRGEKVQRKDGKVFLGGLAVADIDYTKAKVTESQTDLPVYEENLRLSNENTKLGEQFRGKGISGEADGHLFQVHIHHTGLAKENIEAPSPKDIKAEESALSTKPVGSIFHWGIVTKLPTGELSFLLYASKKESDNAITRSVIDVKPLSTSNQPH